MQKALFFLFCSVVFEVSGTSLLKTFLPDFKAFIYMAICIALSYYFLALSLRRLHISIAYAMWEILGGCFIVGISFVVFGESVSTQQALGLSMAFIGIVLFAIDEILEARRHKC